MKWSRGVKVQLHTFLTSESVGGELRFHGPATFSREDSSVSHWTGGAASPKDCVDALKIKISCRQSNPGSYVVQTVAGPPYRLNYRYEH
jgi:hypothetical protein